MKKPYMPRPQADYLKWHNNLATTAGTADGATVGITPDEVATLTTNDADLTAKAKAASAADIAWTAAHKGLTESLSQSRRDARAIAGRAKKNKNYNAVIGDKLRVEGPEDTTDMTQEKPTLAVVVKANGVVEVDFNKLLAEGVHLYCKRGAETAFTYLASETHAAYVDNRPLLVAGQPEVRQYKAVFFIGQAEIGLESDIVTATARP
jgi:hypothetical protein